MAGVTAGEWKEVKRARQGVVSGLRVHTRRGVLQVVLDRPQRRNSITLEMYRALAAPFQEASVRGGVRAVLLTGADSCFSSCADIADFRCGEGQSGSLVAHRELTEGTILAIQGCARPVVTCIAGYCLDGG